MALLSDCHAGHGRRARRRFSVFDLLALYRQRAALRRLDAHRLGDLGLTRKAAEREAGRPFWDVPDHWRQR